MGQFLWGGREPVAPRHLILLDVLLPHTFSLMDRVQSELEAVGRSQFVEYPEQVVPNGVFTQIEFTGDIAVRSAFRHEAYQTLLAIGEQACALRVSNRWPNSIGQRFDEIA